VPNGQVLVMREALEELPAAWEGSGPPGYPRTLAAIMQGFSHIQGGDRADRAASGVTRLHRQAGSTSRADWRAYCEGGGNAFNASCAASNSAGASIIAML
jgi:hypothetical protein